MSINQQMTGSGSASLHTTAVNMYICHMHIMFYADAAGVVDGLLQLHMPHESAPSGLVKMS